MKILLSQNQLPAWQHERAEILQRACTSLKGRIERGERIGRAARCVAARYHGRAFKCDASRQLQLCPVTLRRLYRQWQSSGELPGAFRLKYVSRQSVFTTPLLTRFAQFVVDRPQRSLKSAWQKFCERGGNAGPGRRAGKPLKISYYQIRYAFPASLFYEIAGQHRAIAAAKEKISAIQLKADNYIRANFPEHPPRRARRENDFQI